MVWCGGISFSSSLGGGSRCCTLGRQAGVVASRPLLVSKAMDDMLLAWSLFAFREIPAISEGYFKRGRTTTLH